MSDNDWEKTFFTCKYARYVRHGTQRGYRCVKDIKPFEQKICIFYRPNKKCPEWGADD